MNWGNIIVTMGLPLLGAVWLLFLIRRNALLNPAEQPYGMAVRGTNWLVGFLVTWFFATYLGIYLYASGTQVKTDDLYSGSTWISWVAILIAGLIGALLPYRIHAREGRVGIVGWLITALVYAVLYFVSAIVMSR